MVKGKFTVRHNGRIWLKADYDYLTSTDLEYLLRSVRVPLIKELKRRKLVGRRDALHIRAIHTPRSIEIDILIVLVVPISVSVLESILKKAAKKIRINFREKTKMSRFRKVNIEFFSYRKVVTEFTDKFNVE